MNEEYIKTVIDQVRAQGGPLTLGLKSGEKLAIPANPRGNQNAILLQSSTIVVRLGPEEKATYYYVGFSDIEYIRSSKASVVSPDWI